VVRSIDLAKQLKQLLHVFSRNAIPVSRTTEVQFVPRFIARAFDCRALAHRP